MRLRAPSEDRGVLISPVLDDLPALVERNRSLPRKAEILGQPLVQLTTTARPQLLAAALDYSARYRERSTLPELANLASAPLIVGGHQPQMFHPGVWLKNGVLDKLAKRTGGVALNLVVDGDTLKSAVLPVISGTIEHPERHLVPFDALAGEVPFEERRIVDPAQFASFGHRAGSLLKSLVADPWLNTAWPQVVERGRVTGNVGLAFAQSRHQLEGDWGWRTLELPQSDLARLPIFAWFLADVIARHEMLRDIYNRAIHDYRAANHVRSANHPAAELAADAEGIELPLWIWTVEQPRRRRLFAARCNGGIELTDRGVWQATIPDPEVNPERAVGALLDLFPQGVKLRTRALLTTMFARAFLADLFIHGIGGAKYDTVTDTIIEHFYGLEPPGYALATGTLRLPIDRPRWSLAEVQNNVQQQWRFRYHPEAFFAGNDVSPEVERLLADKRAWIAEQPERGHGRDRQRALRSLNAELASRLGETAERLNAEHVELVERGRNEELLGSREYPWPWYPRETLQNFLLAIR